MKWKKFGVMKIESWRLPLKNDVCTNPVEEHYRKGALIGITGTPALILEDGTKLSGYIPASELIKILNNG